MNEIVNCVAYAQGKRVANVEMKEVHQHLTKENEFVWIGLREPSEEILNDVQKEFQLHELAVEDAHLAHQRPKVEQYADSIFVVLRTAQINEEHHIEFGETHFFAGKNFIVVVRHGSNVPYTEVRARCESTPELLQKGQGFVLYAVMDFIVDRYFPVVHEMELELENIEARIFKDKPNRETTERIYDLKRELLEIKPAVSPLVDVCNRLMRFNMGCISPETRPCFRDVYDHVVRINEMVDNTRELLNRAMEANFSLISIAQSDVSKKFAGWAAIIAVPTMIAGFYGMNFKFIPELSWHYGYYFVIVITISICVTMYFLFRRSGWL
ncbi:MAG: magnesium/cobalt transporter CorA [Chitinophagaceae bacterium]|nr:magnesium/cobalt transporter CorA [Chitinophagaceae bacterium]